MNKQLDFLDIITILSFVVGVYALEIALQNLAENEDQNIISLEDAETYIKMARAWLDDLDAKEHKLWKYFVG